MDNSEDLIIYLNILKICNIIHQKIFNGDHSITIPSMLSESIIKKTFELEDYKSQEENVAKLYDAQKTKDDGTIEYYEIKATSSATGTATINLETSAHVLVWAFFDFNNNEIVINKMADFNNKIKNQLKEVIKKDKISSIRRNKTGKNEYTGEEKFLEVFTYDNSGRTTVSLTNFNWDDKEKITLSMDKLEKKEV